MDAAGETSNTDRDSAAVAGEGELELDAENPPAPNEQEQLPGPLQVDEAMRTAELDDIGGSPTGAAALDGSRSGLHTALERADERMAKLETLLKVEESKLANKARLRLKQKLQAKRLRAIQLEAQKRNRIESIRQTREDNILRGFTDFRAHMDGCLRELKGGANNLYLKIKATLWSIPATKVCLQFKMMDFPALPIHGFTHSGLNGLNITAEQDGSQDLYLAAKKRGLFDCICQNHPAIGSDISPIPVVPPAENGTREVLKNMVGMDLNAIAQTFHSAVDQDMLDIVATYP